MAVVADETSVSAMSIVVDWAAMAAAVTSQLLWLLNFYDFVLMRLVWLLCLLLLLLLLFLRQMLWQLDSNRSSSG